MKKIRTFIAFLVAVVVLLAARHLNVALILQKINALGPWGPLVFIFLYVLACVIFIPGSLLTLGAGALFGVLRGTIYVSIASTLGATLSFIIGRYWARDWVSHRLKGNPKFKAISEAIAREGWKIVGLLRLSPIFPFNLLNYVLGLTEINLKDYIAASWIGMLPGTFLYVFLGSLAGDLAHLSTAGNDSHSKMRLIFSILGLIATAVVTWYIARIARKAIEGKGLGTKSSPKSSL